MKRFLNKLIKTKETRAEELRKQIKEAQTADEVRALGETLDAVLAELQEAKDQLAKLDEQGENNGDTGADEGADAGDNGDNNGSNAQRSGAPAMNTRSFNPIASYSMGGANNQRSDEKGINSMEYRSAFKDFVMRGIPIPAELRENTLTSDTSGAVPTVIIDRIIQKVEEAGAIYARVTKVAYPAGVQIPVANFNIVAEIVGEGEGSTPKKATTAAITFTYYKLRVELSMSMEVYTMSIDAFEKAFVEQAAKAMVKKIDELIINGTGSSQPKGILAETPESGQALEVKEINYQTLCDAEAAVPEEYESDVIWCMNKKTFMAFIGLTDANGQPIARINYGINGKPERTLLGRDVQITKHVKDIADNNIFSFLFNFSDYVLNIIYDMGVQRKQDWDTEDMRTKAVMSIDGKVVNKQSLVTLKKVAGK